MNKKVIVVGIDGATLDLLDPWMENGDLPNLQKLKQHGVSGVLRSTIPPYSAPAWMSIITGVNPGKHGIYDFFCTDSISKKLVSTRHRKSPAIWNYLTDIRKKSLVVNVPGTYPPEKINGIMISGLLTPSEKSEYTYPSTIKNDLIDGKLGYFDLEQVAIDDIPKNLAARYAPAKLVQRINAATVSHGTVALNLMTQNEWDFSMVVFRGTDDAQHLLWDKKDHILSCYKQVDKFVGKFIDQFPEALLFIVSDHGFTKPKKYLYANNVLYNAGYVKTFSDPRHSTDNLLLTLFNKLSKVLFRIVPIEKLVRSSIGRKFILSSGEKKNIDFSQTKAVYHSVCSRGIRILKKEEMTSDQYETFRTELIRLFIDLKDPESGLKIVKKVYRWEEIYGENAVNSPLDLILDMESGYGIQELLQVPEKAVVSSESSQGILPVLSPPGFYDWIGDHAPEGTLFVYGKETKINHRVSASVTDIVPTILAYLNIPISECIDGVVLQDVFQSSLPFSKVVWEPKVSEKNLLCDAELKKIRELRLKL